MIPNRITFTLPIGMTLGASNIWSAQLAGLLCGCGYAADLLLHANVGWHPEVDLTVDPAVRVLTCSAAKVTEASLADIESFAATYAQALPGVVVQNWGMAPYGALAALARSRAADMRVIGVGHADSDGYYDDLVYYESIIHLFLAVSDEIAAEIARRLPHRAEDIVVRPCAVFAPPDAVRPYATEGTPLRITYAGRVTNDQKKLSRVAPLALLLQDRGVNFQLRIIGEGGYKPWLKDDVSKLPLPVRERICIEAGRRPTEMPAVWRESDVCLLLSDFEGTSVSMLEAMAQGCVPVVTRVSGTGSIIQEGRTGYTALPGDLVAMADLFRDLDAHRERLSAMGRAAHRLIVERYSYDVYVPWFMTQIERVKKMPARPWPGHQPIMRPAPAPKGWLSRMRRVFARR